MILLDTCALIWDALAPDQLSKEARSAIARNQDALAVCDISFWEVAMLVHKGRLVVESPASTLLKLALQARHFVVQEITPEIADLSAGLGGEIGSDPADRLIAASSILANAPVVTADRRMRESGIVETIW